MAANKPEYECSLTRNMWTVYRMRHFPNGGSQGTKISEHRRFADAHYEVCRLNGWSTKTPKTATK